MCRFKGRFWTKNWKSMVNVVVSGYGGSKICAVFAGTYFHVRIICMCLIERIGFYVHGLRVLFVWKRLNCELFRFFGCLYAWKPRVQKPTVFTRVSSSVCPPPTRETENELETFAKWPSGGTFWRGPQMPKFDSRGSWDDQIHRNTTKYD